MIRGRRGPTNTRARYSQDVCTGSSYSPDGDVYIQYVQYQQGSLAFTDCWSTALRVSPMDPRNGCPVPPPQCSIDAGPLLHHPLSRKSNLRACWIASVACRSPVKSAPYSSCGPPRLRIQHRHLAKRVASDCTPRTERYQTPLSLSVPPLSPSPRSFPMTSSRSTARAECTQAQEAAPASSLQALPPVPSPYP